jgi:hypothetical protein
MSNSSNSEQERLKRLRDRQLSARDPLVKQKKFQKEQSYRERRFDRRITLKSIWVLISNVWRGIIFSAILGLIGVSIVPQYWDSKWAIPAVIGGTVIVMLLSAIIGNALDVRNNLRELTKR